MSKIKRCLNELNATVESHEETNHLTGIGNKHQLFMPHT